MKRGRDNLRQIASRIVALQAKARAFGLFTHDGDLLECPDCGLLEDVAFVGQLIACRLESLGHYTGPAFACPYHLPAGGCIIGQTSRAIQVSVLGGSPNPAALKSAIGV